MNRQFLDGWSSVDHLDPQAITLSEGFPRYFESLLALRVMGSFYYKYFEGRLVILYVRWIHRFCSVVLYHEVEGLDYEKLARDYGVKSVIPGMGDYMEDYVHSIDEEAGFIGKDWKHLRWQVNNFMAQDCSMSLFFDSSTDSFIEAEASKSIIRRQYQVVRRSNLGGTYQIVLRDPNGLPLAVTALHRVGNNAVAVMECSKRDRLNYHKILHYYVINFLEDQGCHYLNVGTAYPESLRYAKEDLHPGYRVKSGVVEPIYRWSIEDYYYFKDHKI
jgi:hypothetical protein